MSMQFKDNKPIPTTGNPTPEGPKFLPYFCIAIIISMIFAILYRGNV